MFPWKRSHSVSSQAQGKDYCHCPLSASQSLNIQQEKYFSDWFATHVNEEHCCNVLFFSRTILFLKAKIHLTNVHFLLHLRYSHRNKDSVCFKLVLLIVWTAFELTSAWKRGRWPVLFSRGKIPQAPVWIWFIQTFTCYHSPQNKLIFGPRVNWRLQQPLHITPNNFSHMGFNW